jgi:hypothetical protein
LELQDVRPKMCVRSREPEHGIGLARLRGMGWSAFGDNSSLLWKVSGLPVLSNNECEKW